MNLRPIGFSSGALAKSDYRRGIELQQSNKDITAIELSALREPELKPLISAISKLSLDHFKYVSFHAPSRFAEFEECEIVHLLKSIPGSWPIVVHPDLIRDADLWSILGNRLCLENMDMRKRTGRTVAEMQLIFSQLPEAGFCLDLGHARQIDPTMSIAIEMIKTFGDRLRQLHVSEVGTFGEHRSRIGFLAQEAFRKVARYLPGDVPLILESLVAEQKIDAELDVVRDLFAA
jgi:hypothetical protein